ncbi:YicC/YloC family endoribonuclease [Peribacillus sp. NPDC097295]|uniref:YicC/YloC family endoribonuclease n=1 Tax=Peribacillus sp. NPDC097295 TaxID=3364402 RepID=UPI00380CECB2
MVTSMTGYGRGEAQNEQVKVFAEIKTVNHRFCEYTIRMPRQLLVLEEKVKKIANEYIRRGRVEIFITVEGESLVSKNVKIDWDLADQYVRLMDDVKGKYNLESSITLQDMLQLESIFLTEEVPTVPVDLESLLLESLKGALENLKHMRVQEGRELARDLQNQLKKLAEIIEEVKNYAPSVVGQYKTRLAAKLSELTEGLIEESRIVTEAAIFADKCDINEELTRLESHLQQFSGTLVNSEPIGRKLDFLVQEMNREVNTIGSKANDSSITKEVVEMKSLLEKLKEQVQNIE